MSPSKTLENILKVLNSPAYQAQRRAEALIAQTDKITRPMEAILDSLAPFQEAASLASAILESNSIQTFLDELKLDKETITAFKAAGWAIAPSMSNELRDQVIELHKLNKENDVSKLIVAYYHKDEHKNLKEITLKWQKHSLFAPRMHIFRDAIAAHFRQEYTLSVPTLTPQIEGILRDFGKEHELEFRFKDMKQTMGDPKDYPWASSDIASTLLSLLGNNIYSKTDLEQELKKPLEQRKLSRHSILHGIVTNYNTEEYSLRTILTLDSLCGVSYWMSSDFDDA